MVYQPQTWANGAEGGTPISASRLNHIEQGIKAVSDQVSVKAIETLTQAEYDAITPDPEVLYFVTDD